MKIIRLDETAKSAALAETLKVIEKGGIAAFPTETFYGLGVRYDRDDVIERLYSLKQRRLSKALPVIVGVPEDLAMVASSWTALDETIMGAFWPGPLTLLLKAKVSLSGLITGGTGNVAVRIPGPSFALEMARSLRMPVTATSGNISGQPPARRASEILHQFESVIDLLVDGGDTPGGMPSTIVRVSDNVVQIVREGVIRKESIELALASTLPRPAVVIG